MAKLAKKKKTTKCFPFLMLIKACLFFLAQEQDRFLARDIKEREKRGLLFPQKESKGLLSFVWACASKLIGSLKS
jgi:hypothetical protein